MRIMNRGTLNTVKYPESKVACAAVAAADTISKSTISCKVDTEGNCANRHVQSKSSKTRTITKQEVAKRAHCMVIHNYVDRANDPSNIAFLEAQSEYADPRCDIVSQLRVLNSNPNNKNKQLIQFPVKLFAMLDLVERTGHDHIVSWQPHGRCFVIRRPAEFQELLPKYFPGINLLASFKRQVCSI
jgi:HSF-type DNA-binding